MGTHFLSQLERVPQPREKPGCSRLAMLPRKAGSRCDHHFFRQSTRPKKAAGSCVWETGLDLRKPNHFLNDNTYIQQFPKTLVG